MKEEQFSKLLQTIREEVNDTVKVVVNGKIDRIQQKLDDYIASDIEWKNQAKPSIELGRNVNGFGRVLAYILGTFAGIYTIIKFF